MVGPARQEGGSIILGSKFLETVLECLTHPSYVLDANDYTIKLANSAAHRGPIRRTTTCYALTHRKRTPCRSESHPCPLRIVKKTGKPVTCEHVHYDRDGHTRNVEVHGYPICNDDGQVVQMIEYFLDITERRQAEQALQQSEQRYRSFIQNFQGIVFQGYLNFVPVFFHGAVEKITGYREEEFTMGRPRWDQIIHPDDLPLVLEAGRELTTTAGYTTQREYRIVRKDRQIRWLWELIQNVCDDSGKPVLVQGAIYDTTERKRMEEDLRRYREHLEELVEARTRELTRANQQLRDEIARRKALEDELLRIIEQERQHTGRELHDSIGQQLSGVAFMIEVLGGKLSGQGLAEEEAYVQKIATCVNQATEQARILAKGLHPLDLDGGSLPSALQMLAAHTEQLFGISCTARCEPAVSFGDVSAVINLYRIAQEAVTNAIRHGKSRHIEIELAGRDGGVRLVVQNDGVDFPTGQRHSKGMGLRIMHHRAEMICSSLDVRRGAHGGTIVTCFLPNHRLT